MQKTLTFLTNLSQNNNREWFQQNRDHYEESQLEMILFADQVLEEVKKFDVPETPSGKKSLNRIYRDIRFKKDKTPYKDHWGGGIYRAGAERRGSYYYHISPNETYVLGGFFGPNAQDLLHLRNQIAQDGDFLREVLEAPAFKAFFGNLHGNTVKTAPRGFEKNHPDIDLLRHKQFYLHHAFTQQQVLHESFPLMVADAFRRMLPFFNCMTEMLTTDLNGISLLEGK